MAKINGIFLRRKNKIIVNDVKRTDEVSVEAKKFLIAATKNFEGLGYTLSPALFEELSHCSVEYLKIFYLSTIDTLKGLTGANYIYKPMYPNFPAQVFEADDFELLFNAIIHYITDGTVKPQYKKDTRLPLVPIADLKVIDIGTMQDFNAMFFNLMASKTSLSQADKTDLEWYFNTIGLSSIRFPDEIPLKENVAFISELAINISPLGFSRVKKYFKTATDVLRFAVAMSDGDISLAENTKFKKFPRKMRKKILLLLENCGNIEEDMKRYKGMWIRLGEILHPTEYKKVAPKSADAFKKLRENEKIETFNGNVNEAIASGNLYKVLSLLSERPGEFARRLDYILSITDKKDEVVTAFEKIANKVSTPVLLQVRAHFDDDRKEDRIFFPKGNVTKTYVIPETRSSIPNFIRNNIKVICHDALLSQYAEKPPLGNVFISPELKGFIIPQSQRSASASMRPVTRGSRFKINKDAKVLRGFIHWKNLNKDFKYKTDCCYDERVDIDLSAMLLDENWQYVNHVSYTNLRYDSCSGGRACHSGDIVNAPQGACEFIDIDLASFEKAKYHGKSPRYIAFNVYSFTAQPFNEIPECYIGWMERGDLQSGEIFEASTVANRIDLTNTGRMSVPMIYDILNREILWCDINGGISQSCPNNVETNLTKTTAMCKGFANMHKPSMEDVAWLNATVRGTIVFEQKLADVVFALTNDGPKEREIGRDEEDNPIMSPVKYITPFDIDVWMSDLI